MNFIKNNQSSNSFPITSWNEPFQIQNYDTTSGLPNMKYSMPCNFKNKILFATDRDIYEFNEQKNKFLPYPFLGKEIQEDQVYLFVTKDSQAIWSFTFTLNE